MEWEEECRMNGNVFSNDDFKKQVLESEGLLDDHDSDYTIPEPVDSDDVVLGNIVSSAPKIPKQVKTIIQDASMLTRQDKESKAAEINSSLNKVFTEYNEKFGTNLSIDLNSLSRTLVNVADPKSRRTLELYLSEIFQSIRPILLIQMISRLSLLIDDILQPEVILDAGGNSGLSIADRFLVVDQIMNYIQKLEEMKEEIIIDGSNLELQKIGEEAGGEDVGNLDSEAVQDFYNAFFKDHLKGNNEEKDS